MLALSVSAGFAQRGLPRRAGRPALSPGFGKGGPLGTAAEARQALFRRHAVEQVNAVELYGPVFAFAIGISVGGYGFAWLVGQIIERTDSYELLGKLLAGEEEKQAFEREMKEELRRKEEEERLEAAAAVGAAGADSAESELEEYRDY